MKPDYIGAKQYISRIKNPAKRAYANGWYHRCVNNTPNPVMTIRLSVMAAQAARMQLAEFGIDESTWINQYIGR